MRLADLEKGLLEALATAEGDLLEDTSLIERLSETKATAAEIQVGWWVGGCGQPPPAGCDYAVCCAVVWWYSVCTRFRAASTPNCHIIPWFGALSLLLTVLLR